MKIGINAILAVLVGALMLSACSERKAAPAAADEASMPQGMAMLKDDAPAMQEHSASGEVTVVDASAGTVTISHGAVASAGWPAMTMTFNLDAKRAAGLKPKEHVQFKFTLGSAGEAFITSIEPMTGM
jgi:Cu(I)/Ag(I) efflux system protein CusF